jgi:hypothetical protein
MSSLLPALLAEDAVAAPGGLNDTDDGLLGRHVRGGGEVASPFLDPGNRLAVQVTNYLGTSARGGYSYRSITWA